MNNDDRRTAYLAQTGSTTLTTKQARRIRKHDNATQAVASRSMRRHAHRDVKRADRIRLAAIRARFAAMRTRPRPGEAPS